MLGGHINTRGRGSLYNKEVCVLVQASSAAPTCGGMRPRDSTHMQI